MFKFQYKQQLKLRMIDYYETKSQPITRVQVWEAYWKVRKNKGGMGIDGMSWEALDKTRDKQLYKLWNRLSSGSYFPPPVKEVEIDKKDGGKRKLGIPTILDRIAQEVVRVQLDKYVEPKFHKSSYGYRKGRSQHQAVREATRQALQYKWAIDIDIKGYFDTIDHELLLKAVYHYCKDKWVLMYIKRWLRSGILQKDGTIMDRITGTPQGGVVSPLLSNIFLHVVFDKWMEIHHPEKPFERYADDIVFHCMSEKQALFVKSSIQKRMEECKLIIHPLKTKVVNFRGESEKKYPRKLDFLGFTIKLQMVRTKADLKLMTTSVMSRKSMNSALEKFRAMNIHKMRTSIESVSAKLSPIIRGIMNDYCKFWNGHTFGLWWRLNDRQIILHGEYFSDFYKNLDSDIKSKIQYVFELIKQVDRVPKRFLAPMTGYDGLFEIRVEYQSYIFRIFCCFDQGQLGILFNGFQKKTQKTPKKEIEKAMRLKQAYFKLKSKKT